jgi:copper(I)-binding protein
MNPLALKNIARYTLAAWTLAVFSSVSAHVSLQQATADAGSAYRAVLRVGHGCDGAATTAITVQVPPGFADAQPQPRNGWTLTRQGADVSWVAEGKQNALASGSRGEFIIDGKLPTLPAALWFKVRQSCDQARIDWDQLPPNGTSVEGMKTPAVLLQVQAPALVKVEDGWVHSTVPGQRGSAGYMKLTARVGHRLVGASSPAAGVAEVHDMKMEGDVMRMRPVRALELPAGKMVELRPGGMHLMLMDLKQPLVTGTSVPLTLVFRDGRGVESKVETRLLVSGSPPAAGASPAGHKH